jgi:tetratricopeptide (TPR) repeat protein
METYMGRGAGCKECGAVLVEEIGGEFCASCLLGLGLKDALAGMGGPAESDASELPVTAPATAKKPPGFGDYELLEELARGGMGVVYKARQISLNRIVALKLISAGTLATQDLVKRFKAEAEAAASLSHPNIVPIYEIGEHQGQHYFSMALIEGPNLFQALAQARSAESAAANQGPPSRADSFAPRQAARLVATIARAVHYAHQRGVLHRDLKPGNILLDPQGQPHLTDFGLAKLVQADSTLTRTHAVLGTPAYMAPEQARGDTRDVTTTADVYGLGAVLYETLTGKPPFSGTTPIETIRQALEEEPRRPSVLNPAVDRDLEAICLKCLEKTSARRYASAEALADDLDAWLRQEPVQARPANTAYRLQKAFRRHKLVFAGVAGIVAALLLGLIGTTVGLWRAKLAEHKAGEKALLAQQEAEKARAVKDFLVEQVLGVNPYMEGAADPSRRVLVEKVEREIGERFASRPEIEADLRFALATAFSGIGDTVGHLRQVERAYQIRRSLFGLTNSDTLHALSAVAALYHDVGHKEESEKLFREGLAVVRASPHSLSEGEAHLLCEYGNLRANDGQLAEGLTLLQEGIPALRRTADPKSWRFQTKLAWLPALIADAGRVEEAEAMFTEQLRERERIFGPEHPMTAQLRKAQAAFFQKLGRLDQAASGYERAIPVYYGSIGSNHWMTCQAETDLAHVYEQQGRIQDAAKLYRSVYPRLVNKTNYPMIPSVFMRCVEIAQFFARNRMVEDTKAVLGPLMGFFKQNRAADQGVEALNGLAWLLASCPIPELRDGSNAVLLAETAVSRTSRKDPGCLDTLAAAYAEIGDFAKAVSVQEEAKASNKDLGLTGELTAHLNVYKSGAPLRLYNPDLQTGIELLVADVVIRDGWPAAGEFCRSHFDSFADQPLEWRAKAVLFAYAGDNDWYRKAAGRAIDLAPQLTSWEEQLAVLNAATRMPFEFSASERDSCAALVRKVEGAMSHVTAREQLRGRRAIGAMQLRLGRASEGLSQLETVLRTSQPPLHREITLLFKSLCLARLGQAKEAREAFEEARQIVETVLPETLPATELPIAQDQLTSLILLREANTAIVSGAQ